MNEDEPSRVGNSACDHQHVAHMSRRCRVPAECLSEVKKTELRLPERHTWYFPNEPELAILIPSLVEHFKHPPRARTRSDEIVRTVMQFAEANPMKWTHHQVRM
jgi:hypothetical protein